jgi:hypothetical protein
MSLLRKTRTEVAGAWRSLRYDMGKRPADAPEPLRHGPDVTPDVTSTGMSTFGGPVGDLTRGYDEDLPRRPRRLVAVSAFGVLALTGGIGSYFAVVHGLGPALAGEQSPAPPQAQAEGHTYPLTATRDTPAGNAGMGRAEPLKAPAAVVADPASPKAVRTTAPAARAVKPARSPAIECDCLTNPPVPTPTAPSGSPSPTPSATASPSATSSSPSASTSVSPSPSGSSESLGRKRRHPSRY